MVILLQGMGGEHRWWEGEGLVKDAMKLYPFSPRSYQITFYNMFYNWVKKIHLCLKLLCVIEMYIHLFFKICPELTMY